MKSIYLVALALLIFPTNDLWAQRQKEVHGNKEEKIQKPEQKGNREFPQIKHGDRNTREQPQFNGEQNQLKKEPPVQKEPVKVRDNKKLEQGPITRSNDRNNGNGANPQKLEKTERSNTKPFEDRRGNNGTEIYKDRRVAKPIVRVAPPAKPFVPVDRNIHYNYTQINYRPDYRRPYSFIGIRYNHFYGPRYYVPYRGARYCYHGGFFYSPFDTYFEVVFAPIGIRVWGLPWGYRRFYIGPTLYYYYGGTYYRPYNTSYEVVEAPLGSILPEVPRDAKVVVINNHKYYELNGTYYAETFRGDETWYTVVGKNGVLNQQTVSFREEPNTVVVGDMVTELPEDYTVEVVNNEKYYMSKGTYFKEVITDNNIGYKVVTKPN